jgi:hypothetical protein
VTSETAQLALLPEVPPVLGAIEDVPLDRLPPDGALAGPAPSPQLVESIRRWGVLEPVLVRAVGGALAYDDPATLISGRRRIKAVRALHAEYLGRLRKLSASVPPETLLSDATVPGYRAVYERVRAFVRVPVRIVSDPEGLLTDGRTEVLLVATNAVRADNPQADFKALATLLDKYTAAGLSERDCLTRASQDTGLPVGTVKQRLRLRHLSPELGDDFLAGRLGYTVALHASRLGPEAQEVLAGKLDAGARVTLETVKDAKREAVQAVQAGLFDDLPMGEGVPHAPSVDARDQAVQMAAQLRAIKMPIMQEAAGVIERLTAIIDADHRDLEALEARLRAAGAEPVVNADPPTLPEDEPPAETPERPKRPRRKKVTE